jgi:3-deoxy-D-manno-octulosonic-acid transferase
LIKIFLTLYNFAWLAVLPFLKRSPRVSLGWQQRTLKKYPEGPFDLWIQAASGGESLLTNMVLEKLADSLPQKKHLRILVTSGTKQGIDSLLKGGKHLTTEDRFDITVAYFPLDAPHLMDKAFTLFTPKLVVIVETELWPGFLVTAKRNKVPVLLINGRMSEKSFRSYKYLRKFFIKYGPDRVLAISRLDGDRFSRIVGHEKVTLMNNIKFDRIEPVKAFPKNNPNTSLLPPDAPFVLLGSIRREEEEKILTTVVQTLSKRPDIIIGLFPKHIDRAGRWLEMLAKEKIDAVKRSDLTTLQPPGTVIVWDVFGELAGAYALAGAAFVGGSIIKLGGQNFLEPLVFGLKPIIGPYWKNFAWVGREIVESGLVYEISDEHQLATRLLGAIDADDSRDEVIDQVQAFFEPRKGGTRQVCRVILENLNSIEKR